MITPDQERHLRPGTGQTGFNALGEIVAGEVNPSGHSADTFVYDLTAAPYFNNIGDFAYTNADSVGYTVASQAGGDAKLVPRTSSTMLRASTLATSSTRLQLPRA